MKIRTAKEIGAYVRDRRRVMKITQAWLAEKVGVSRVWLSEFERGKDSAEIGLALRTLFAVGTLVDISETPPIPEGEIDLREVLRRHTRKPSGKDRRSDGT